ncbi:MAG: hypothetical protein QGF59_30545, partial [Pirellulaceae bacterium]|nr:hypothetical protein [Pirellulaceae bacterium]
MALFWGRCERARRVFTVPADPEVTDPSSKENAGAESGSVLESSNENSWVAVLPSPLESVTRSVPENVFFEGEKAASAAPGSFNTT